MWDRARPGGDTVTEVMWGAHSGHRSTSASRCHASSSGVSTSKTRLTVALVMNSTSSAWQPSTVGDGASRSMRQPINDIAEGSPERYGPGQAGTSPSVECAVDTSATLPESAQGRAREAMTI
jgi:hypothetical protein